MAGMTIGKLAAGEGVGVETVRFYQRRGLLALPDRAGSGFREYSEDDRRRLAFIRRARQLGFTLGRSATCWEPGPATNGAPTTSSGPLRRSSRRSARRSATSPSFSAACGGSCRSARMETARTA
jgi:MerR HTH family regulatory protein